MCWQRVRERAPLLRHVHQTTRAGGSHCVNRPRGSFSGGNAQAAVIDQLPALVDLLDAMGLCTVAYPANEADDVIGTMVQRLCAGADRDAAAAATTEGNVHTYIVSTDKDFQQLLGAGCSIMKPLNGGGQ